MNIGNELRELAKDAPSDLCESLLTLATEADSLRSMVLVDEDHPGLVGVNRYQVEAVARKRGWVHSTETSDTDRTIWVHSSKAVTCVACLTCSEWNSHFRARVADFINEMSGPGESPLDILDEVRSTTLEAWRDQLDGEARAAADAFIAEVKKAGVA